MKHLKIFTLLVLATIAIAASCNKTPTPAPDDFYFRCKINGQTYIPNNCANCMVGKLLGDTALLINGNAGYETVLIGVTNKPIIQTSYLLNSNITNGGTYKNSTTTTDRFDTDATRTGQLLLTSLDKANRIITGTFYFQAYNPVQNKTINITDGEFRLKYTTN